MRDRTWSEGMDWDDIGRAAAAHQRYVCAIVQWFRSGNPTYEVVLSRSAKCFECGSEAGGIPVDLVGQPECLCPGCVLATKADQRVIKSNQRDVAPVDPRVAFAEIKQALAKMATKGAR